MYIEPTELERAVIKAERKGKCEFEIRLGDGLIDDCTIIQCGKPIVGHDLETEQARCERHMVS